jgi:hypothetical protein
MDVLTFILNNLEIIIASAGGLGAVYLFTKRNPRKVSNDLTSQYIKYKKHQESINQATKSAF